LQLEHVLAGNDGFTTTTKGVRTMTIPEFIAYAKANPGEASSPIGVALATAIKGGHEHQRKYAGTLTVYSRHPHGASEFTS
jgi:hypothetical protein